MGRRAPLLVGAGGFAGALCRHGVAVALPATFPWGTLAVNVAGAFLLGLLVYEATERGRIPETARRFASTGFLSSFTTYSTFAAETAALAPRFAALNVAANYAFGLVAVLLARGAVRWRS